MRILIISKDCHIGGVEAFSASLASVLKKRGHECELFFLTRGPMERQLPTGLTAHFGDIADCMKMVRSRRFDLVHGYSGDWDFGIAAVRAAAAKLVITAHGWIIPGWNSTNCDAFVCCSRWQADEQRAFTDLPLRVIFNGIDTDLFRPAEGPAPDMPDASSPVVAWVGRGTDITFKRMDKLAAVAPLLRRAGVRLWVADPYGPDEVEKVLPETAQALRAAADFWGEVARERLPEFFRQVAASGGCVISTSAREGLPLALVEAQASGCPVIGPDVRGVNEVINPEHGGMLYPFETTSEELARLILGVVGDTAEARRRGEQCAAYARARFGLERMTDEYLRVYEETLSASRRRRTAGHRARQWLAPLLSWGEYVERRWTAGLSHYEASRRLAAEGEWELARRAARLSVETCPSLYAKPGRLGHLLRLLLRRGRPPGGGQIVKKPVG